MKEVVLILNMSTPGMAFVLFWHTALVYGSLKEKIVDNHAIIQQHSPAGAVRD